jgi:hypothetical protein
MSLSSSHKNGRPRDNTTQTTSATAAAAPVTSTSTTASTSTVKFAATAPKALVPGAAAVDAGPRRILFGVVATHLDEIIASTLAHGVSGNFLEIAQHVLPSIPKSEEESSQSTAFDQWAIHYHSVDNLIYMCMADNAVPPTIIFKFFTDCKMLFKQAYGDSAYLKRFEIGFYHLINFYNEQIQAHDFEMAKLQRPNKKWLARGYVENEPITTDGTDAAAAAASLSKAKSSAAKAPSALRDAGVPGDDDIAAPGMRKEPRRTCRQLLSSPNVICVLIGLLAIVAWFVIFINNPAVQYSPGMEPASLRKGASSSPSSSSSPSPSPKSPSSSS